jgi:Putative prokaryotic signal transducing protein
MGSPSEDFAVLLAAPDPTEAHLARNLLESAGIPSLLHGQDRDYAELGASGHLGVSRPDLLVPRSAFDKAREVLREAWGVELPGGRFAKEKPLSRRSRLLWLLVAAIIVLPFVVIVLRGMQHPAR